LKRLIGYITAAYPDRSFTTDLILAMAERGCDGIELGIPFSDPVADGPIIEEANMRALKGGFRFADILTISQEVGNRVDLYWMGYFNPFYRRGLKRVVQEARSLGIKGLIIPDLPYEERMRHFKMELQLPIIDFVAPTDPPERIGQILPEDGDGFVYLVAYAGITGANKREELAEVIGAIRQATKKPLYIGFGVNEETAKERSQGVDGVIVGSAFIKILLDDSLTAREKIDKIASLSGKIKEIINS